MWVDPGATATDAEDGDLTDKIVRDASQLDTATPGVYRVAYSVVDSAGCETRAVRYVRVIALVATSDAAYLSTLCMRQVPRVTMTCEVGMQRHEDHRPNPAAFPACCLLAQEMDASACFCDGRVVGELNVRNATFFNDLVDFTPMACGFKIKTGEVCTDMRALERFFSEEIVDTGEEVATVEELITEGGALNAELPCNEQIEAVHGASLYEERLRLTALFRSMTENLDGVRSLRLLVHGRPVEQWGAHLSARRLTVSG